MDAVELQAKINQGKGAKLDWHPQNVAAPTLAASLVALANGPGGTVLVGLTPRSGRLQSLSDPEATLDLALEAALSVSPPLIIPLPQVIEVQGHALLHIDVPPGLPHVYNLDGKYLHRDGTRNRPLSIRALRRLMMARGELSWEAQVPDGASSDDDAGFGKGHRRQVDLSIQADPGQSSREGLCVDVHPLHIAGPG